MTLRVLSIAVGIGLLASAPATAQERLKRADSFFGLHFDFHAGPDCTEVGKHTTRAMVENLVDQVRPDYLQIDCKGHRGLSSYPTRVGHPAPGFVGDPLRTWREVTAERGVALYMHYSGVWDAEAIARHPDWAAINADGKPNERATSLFGPYADQLLIPQLRELAGEYDVDGVWVDGDCWASVPDWSEPALQAYREATGSERVPRRASDPDWFEFLEFHREAFRRYLRHNLAEMERTHPDFQVCSNWAFSDHMPEPVSADVDFISGDYSPDNSVNSARLSARYLARQGKPWDLMAWSFSRTAREQGQAAQKTAVQLQREAAVVLALGGGFQAYFKQKRDGSIYDEQLPVMAEVARFCRARQAICHRAEQVPQVALLFSTPGHYRRCTGLFSRELSRIQGTLEALLESQHSVEVLGEHQLTGRLGEYPLVVVPEWDYLEPEFIAELVAYAQGGGNLLVIGPASTALFQSHLDVITTGGPEKRPRTLVHGDLRLPIEGVAQAVKAGPTARTFAALTSGDASNQESQPAATVTPLGRGRIAAVWFELGQAYRSRREPALRQFLDSLARELFPQPIVQVQGSRDVDVTVSRLGGKLAVHLVNTAGDHRGAGILQTIPPVGPLAISIRQPAKPSRVTREPGGQAVEFAYRDGAVELKLDQLEIHEAIVVE